MSGPPERPVPVERARSGEAGPVGDASLHRAGPRLSVVVPLKDEEPSLAELVRQVRAAMATCDSGGWELIFVDDGSTDGSWGRILELAAEEPHVRGLRLRANFGKSAALAAGVSAAVGQIVVTLDADLQDDPAEIPALLADLRAGADLVSGYKVSRQDPWSKRLPSKVFNRVTSIVFGLKLHDHNCGLKVARREVLEGVPLYGELHRYVAATAHADGWRVVERPVNHRARQHGTSKFGAERYVRGALDLLTVVALTRFGRRPAHLFGGIGAVAMVAGLLILTYLSGVWAFTDEPIGDRPLLLLGVLLLVTSVQLLSTGMLAELQVHKQSLLDDPRRRVLEQTRAQHDHQADDV
jgi:glycosyltransferase involved in cell wall biosynthesis